MVGGVVGGVDADDANGVVLLPPAICPICEIFVERSKQVEVVARVGVVLENRHFSKIAIFLKILQNKRTEHHAHPNTT